jgi:hypothetical protein
MMDQEIAENIQRKLIHIKARPTRLAINNLYIILKNMDFINIPILKQNEYTYSHILKFCNDITDLISDESNIIVKTNASNKYISVKLEESSFLPENIYTTNNNHEKNDDDNLELTDAISVTDTNDSDINEEDVEEGYEFYASDGDDWSE